MDRVQRGIVGLLAIAFVASAEAAPPTFAKAHPRIYLDAHRAQLTAALDAKSPAQLRYRNAVGTWLSHPVSANEPWGFPAWHGALLGVLSGDPKMCAHAIAKVEAQVAAAEAKISKGEPPEVAGDDYLGAGDMLGDVALVYDWCNAAVTPAQGKRWFAYASSTLRNLWNPKAAVWGGKARAWDGWAIDNPSNNYYYSFLRATMLVGLAWKGDAPEADGWIKMFRETRIARELVPVFTRDLAGGGSREGTGYGVAMRRLFELYDFWKGSTGEDLAALTPHARESMLAFIHQILPTLDRVAPTGDHARESTAAFFDYHRNYLQILIGLFPTDPLAARAKWVIDASSVPQMSQPFMYAYDVLYDNTSVRPKPLAGLDTAYFARGIGQLYLRSDWSKDATWVNLTAGAYTESHAHEDQAALLIYKGGWLAEDAVVHSRSGLPQATTAHGLVRLEKDGKLVRQHAETTSAMVALHRGDGFVFASADATAAYRGEAGVSRVQRDIVYLAPDVVVVFDRVTSDSATRQTWQLPTPNKPAITGDRATLVNGAHELVVTRIAGGGAMSAFDLKADADFTGGWRLENRSTGGDNRYLHVLSIDGAAQETKAVGATGVEVKLAAGIVTIVFDRDAPGATVTIGAKKPVKLAAGVERWPDAH
jgi:hypothetical protein